MSERDLQRIEILSKVVAERMTVVSAAHVLDLSDVAAACRVDPASRVTRLIPFECRISRRPDFVDDRWEFGHWEGDLLIFNRDFGEANITSLIERKSRYTVLIKNRRPLATDHGQDHCLPKGSRFLSKPYAVML